MVTSPLLSWSTYAHNPSNSSSLISPSFRGPWSPCFGSDLEHAGQRGLELAVVEAATFIGVQALEE